MKTPSEIVEALAREKRIEALVSNVCRRPADELKDLSQLVYLALLQTPASLLSDLYENGQLDFYAVRIIQNQYYSCKSRYYREIVRFQLKSRELNYNDYEKADFED